MTERARGWVGGTCLGFSTCWTVACLARILREYKGTFWYACGVRMRSRIRWGADAKDANLCLDGFVTSVLHFRNFMLDAAYLKGATSVMQWCLCGCDTFLG